MTEINLALLNKTNHGQDFSATDTAEPLVVEALCTNYNLQDCGGTVGNVPEYDWIINDTQVEIKMSQNSTLFIEVAKADGTASGLEVTTSDVHMFVNPASTKIDGKWVDMMKVRIIKTAELRAWINYMARQREEELVVFEPSWLGKGSAGFYLNLKTNPGPDIEDLFVLGFAYTKNDAGEIIMDTEKVIMPNNRYALSKINDFIK